MFEIWIQAITGPNEDNYRNILKSGDPSFGTAALWMVIAGIVGGVVSGGVALIFGSPLQDVGMGVGVLFVVYPIIIIISFFFSSGLYYIVAKALGGQGSFGEQSYLLAAGLAPANIIGFIIGSIPLVGACVALLISLYTIYLNILSIKTSHEFDWGKAVATVLIPVVLLFGISCVCIVILTLSGAAVGGVFEEIVRELETR